MRFLDQTLDSVAENLALDEALLMAAESDGRGDVLRVWEWPTPAIVLGAASILKDDVDLEACQADRVPVLRRSSGGGTVLLGPGCLLYSLVLAYESSQQLRHIGSSYCYVFERVVSALDVPGLACAGVSDLAIHARKVSGNSQQRKRNYLLHHGTLLYAFDSARMHRYLRLPARQPDYRRGRSHDVFLTNLPLSRDDISAKLRRAFGAEHELTDSSMELVQKLVGSKYAKSEWTQRR